MDLSNPGLASRPSFSTRRRPFFSEKKQNKFKQKDDIHGLTVITSTMVTIFNVTNECVQTGTHYSFLKLFIKAAVNVFCASSGTKCKC